jgi:hypothetical protein
MRSHFSHSLPQALRNPGKAAGRGAGVAVALRAAGHLCDRVASNSNEAEAKRLGKLLHKPLRADKIEATLRKVLAT